MRRIPYQLILRLAVCSTLAGCVSYPTLTAEQLKGPAIKVQPNKLAQNQELACARIKPLQIPATDYQQAAREAGILADDFLSLQQTVTQQHIIISIRDVNTSCTPYLQAGYPSKNHEVLTKTFTAESLSTEYQYLAGTVSTLAQKPKPGEKINDPLSKQYLTRDGNQLTCDYDLMDVAQANGQRIEGETTDDLQLRKKLNANLPWRGQPPRPVPRITHGAQAEYPNYLRAIAKQHIKEEPILGLNKPEAPLTAFIYNGDIYRLQQIEDALNFYLCHNISVPEEWNIQY